jgi:ketosteroid isomerase-like protein
MNDEPEILESAYRNFNARGIDAVLAHMHPDVEWANGMEGGHVHGQDEVRAYWTRQFLMLDPHVEPLRIELDEQGRWVVEVRQVVHDLAGNLLLDTLVHHVYQIRDGLIQRMDIVQQNSPAGRDA